MGKTMKRKMRKMEMRRKRRRKKEGTHLERRYLSLSASSI